MANTQTLNQPLLIIHDVTYELVFYAVVGISQSFCAMAYQQPFAGICSNLIDCSFITDCSGDMIINAQ
jgi:hypothetical protein